MPTIRSNASLSDPRYSIPGRTNGLTDAQTFLPKEDRLYTCYSAAGYSFSFEVRNGLIWYADEYELSKLLKGRDEENLIINGTSIQIDTSALKEKRFYLSELVVPGVPTPWPSDLPIVLAPGRYLLCTPMGYSFFFDVGPDGNVHCDPALSETVSATGKTLTIKGSEITIDTSALADQKFYLSGLDDPKDPPPWLSPKKLALAPSGYLLCTQAGLSFAFQVGPDGNVHYAPTLQFQEKPVKRGTVSGEGSKTLTVKGSEITIDTSTLTDQSFYLGGIEVPGQPTPWPSGKKLVLAPGGYILHLLTGDTFGFSVVPEGTLHYDASLSGALSGESDTTLVVNGKSGATGLIAYWPLDGTETDVVGSRNLVRDNGLNFASGVRAGKQALEFRPRRVGRPTDDSQFNLVDTDFTIQAWIYFCGDLDREQTFFEKFSNTLPPAWTLTKLASQQIRFHGPVVLDSSSTVTTAQWHHVIVRKKLNEYSLFINGVKQASATSDNAMGATSKPLLVGRRIQDDPRDFAFYGRICELAIWVRALSDKEVESLFNGGSALPANEL